MIEHYAMYSTGDITDRFTLKNGLPKGVKPRFNISPTQVAPVILSQNSLAELQLMSYGLVPDGAKDANSVFRYKTFNVRSDKAFSKLVWEAAIKHQRCIIPMNGFYMQRSGKDGDVYYFSPSQDIMAVAGMYTSWAKSDGSEQRCFALLTIEANTAMPLPFAKMPVLLHPDDEGAWLDDSVTEFGPIIKMMRPFEGNALHYSHVSGEVMSAKNDSSALIERVQRTNPN